MFTNEQIEFAVQCVVRWIEESKKNPSSADAHHSGLLRRLLSGKTSLEKPPPKIMGYPCYDLAEGKLVRVYDVHDTANERVSIDSCVDWLWHDRELGILQHVPSSDLYWIMPKTEVPAESRSKMPLSSYILQKVSIDTEPYTSCKN